MNRRRPATANPDARAILSRRQSQRGQEPSARRRRHRPSLCLAASALSLTLAGCAGGSAAAPETTRIEVGDRAERLASARRLALEAQETEDPGQAIAKYRQALKAYPDLAAAWNNLGVRLLAEERYMEAAEAFASASDHSQAEPRPLYNLGLTWERAGYLSDALKHYKQALDRDPRYLPALRGALRSEILIGEASEQTLERLRLAIGLETDPRWRQWFQDQRSIVERRLYERPGLTSPDPADDEAESTESEPPPPGDPAPTAPAESDASEADGDF